MVPGTRQCVRLFAQRRHARGEGAIAARPDGRVRFRPSARNTSQEAPLSDPSDIPTPPAVRADGEPEAPDPAASVEPEIGADAVPEPVESRGFSYRDAPLDAPPLPPPRRPRTPVPDATETGPHALSPEDMQPGLEALARRQVLRHAITKRVAPVELFRSKPSSLIADRYVLDRPIGSGGAGVVYRANDTKLTREVAIKLLHPGSVDGTGVNDLRFRREAEALARVSHPHIINVYDYGSTGTGGYFLAMEFVDGDTLEDLIEGGEVNLPRGLELLAQVCDALAYAHKQGIVHRDLKPSNILVKYDIEDIAKVADFGLAKSIGDTTALTQAGLIVGSIQYMAPEQALALDMDARVDIYAMGVMLFRMVTGTYPYPGDDAARVLNAIVHAAPPHVGQVRPTARIPEDLDKVIEVCTASDPSDRYQDIARLGRHLRRLSRVDPSNYLIAGDLQKERTRRLALERIRNATLAVVVLIAVLGCAAMVGLALARLLL